MKKHLMLVFSALFIMALAVYPAMAEPFGSESSSEGFSFNAPFSGIVIGSGEKADLDLKLTNLAADEKTVDLQLRNDPKAKDWKVMLSNSQWGGFGVTKVRLGRSKPDNVVSLKLHIEPSKGAQPGEYSFLVNAKSGRISRDIPIHVQLKGDKVALEKKKAGIDLSCKYASMENASGKEFKFDVDVKNQGSDEAVVDFSTMVPEGWASSLSPRWETGKNVDSIRLDKKGSEKLIFTLTPPDGTDEDKYPVTLVAKTGDITKKLFLSAVVNGTYKLQMMPETKRLNVNLVAGQENKIVLYLWNEGSAPVNNVSLFSSQPEGWKVDFSPKKLTQVAPLTKTQKPEKVEVSFTVPQRTIPGDYAIHISAAGDQSRAPLDLRATVEVPTQWGWTGIAIIVIVIVLLMGIFLKLKRR